VLATCIDLHCVVKLCMTALTELVTATFTATCIGSDCVPCFLALLSPHPFSMDGFALCPPPLKHTQCMTCVYAPPPRPHPDPPPAGLRTATRTATCVSSLAWISRWPSMSTTSR
jgi:hypothetical protein